MHKLVMLLTGVLAATVHAADIPDDWLIERIDQSPALEGVDSVAMLNDFGDIRVRSSKDGKLHLHAVVQRHRDDQDVPEIHSRLVDGKLELRVTYRDPDATQAPAGPKRRIDLSAFVPSGLSLILRTRDGLAESKGHASTLDIETIKGRINVETRGLVHARSARGAVQVAYENRVWTGASSIATDTGPISVILVGDPDLMVHIDTAGDITTDYSLDVQHVPGSARKKAAASIGAASHELTLTSKRGPIKLGRLFDLIPARPAVAGQSGVQ